MNAKEYIAQVKKLQSLIDRNFEEYEELQAIAEKTTSCVTGMPHGGGEKRKFENVVVKIACLEQNIEDNIQKLIELQIDINNKVVMLPDPDEQVILIKRYIKGETWNQIAVEMNFSDRTIFRKHQSALKHLDKILNDGSNWQ